MPTQQPSNAARRVTKELCAVKPAGKEVIGVARAKIQASRSTCIHCGRTERLGFADLESVRAGKHPRALRQRTRAADRRSVRMLADVGATLWMADAAACCTGAGGAWRARIDLVPVATSGDAKPGSKPAGEESGTLPQLLPWLIHYAMRLPGAQHSRPGPSEDTGGGAPPGGGAGGRRGTHASRDRLSLWVYESWFHATIFSL